MAFLWDRIPSRTLGEGKEKERGYNFPHPIASFGELKISDVSADTVIEIRTLGQAIMMHVIDSY